MIGIRNPALRAFAQHHGLRIEPAALVEQAAQLAAVFAILLDRVFVVNAGDQALVGDVEQRQAGSFVDSAALGFDDAVFDLVAHAQAVTAADAVGFEHQLNGIGILVAVEGDGPAFHEADRDFFALDLDIVAPGRNAHDGLDDPDAARSCSRSLASCVAPRMLESVE